MIDLFAGPGGLGEGFSAFETNAGKLFDIKLSIEKDSVAHQTLMLRSFFREFKYHKVPDAYYDRLRGLITSEDLFGRFPQEAFIAETKSWNAELGGEEYPRRVIRHRINAALEGADNWVLIGGPPCQAYSLAGRSRNRGNQNYDPASDKRQHLYVEYLQTIADHWPAIFVMENVKGLLSATLENQKVFHKIVDDLQNPVRALRRENRTIHRNGRTHCYRLYPLVESDTLLNGDLIDYVIKAENYGVPQARHRVILVGVRDDLGDMTTRALSQQDPIPASMVLSDLPRVRSGLSQSEDSAKTWIETLSTALDRRWFTGIRKAAGEEVYDYVRDVVQFLIPPEHDRGGEFLPVESNPDYAPAWFVDDRLEGICNHSTRGHIPMDLHRYLFSACFAQVHRRSATLKDFPPDLLPDHDNVVLALEGGNFSDRFRVQVEEQPATTVTSHISKDGHYYIHPDPTQCRSLTVREAARLQTFPDNYFFAGARTSQYVQVGNAVPPLLALQIAEIVSDILADSGLLT